MNQPSQNFYEFDLFRLYPLERLLVRHDTVVPLPPKIFDILLLLIRNSGHLLRKEEIIRVIWPDTFVEEGNLARYISTLRRILGENPGEHPYILTIPRHGYRFVAAVREVGGSRSRQPATARLSIAVLPFKHLITAQRDQLLEMGLAETLITCLSAPTQVIVRPISAIHKYASSDQDAVAVGRELNVETVLDGSIQRAGDRVRVGVQLLKVADGSTMWSGRFDDIFTDIFTFQDSISEQIASRLIPVLSARPSTRRSEVVFGASDEKTTI